MKKIALLFTLLVAAISLNAQTLYTWTGSTSTDWATASNWSPSAVPGSSDHIQLSTGTNMPVLDQNRSVTNIAITAGTMDLGGDTLTVTGTTTLTGGTVNNGVLRFNNGTTTISGMTFGAVVNATVSLNVELTNNTFSNAVIVKKTGGGHNSWNGNSYASTLKVLNTTNSYNIYLAGNTNVTYNGDVTLAATGTGSIYLTGGTATSTFATGKRIIIGTEGLSSALIVTNVVQSDTVAQNFTATGATINITGSQFGGKVTVNSAHCAVTNSTFNGPLYYTKANGSNDYWNGNTYNSTLKVYNNSTGNSIVYLSGNSNVTYNGDVTISSGNNGSIHFSSGSASSTIAAGKKIVIGSEGFARNLTLKNVVQSDTVTQTLAATGILTVENSQFSGTVNFTGGYLMVNGSTFSGTSTFHKTGGWHEAWNNNTFNGVTHIKNGANVNLFLTDNLNSSFNNNITVSNTGSGSISFSNAAGVSTLASGKTITVGSGGFATGSLNLSRLVQSGSTAQSITLTGSASFRALNSTFNGPWTVSAPHVYLNGGNTFNSTLSITKTAAGSNDWTGGNTYNGDVTVTNTSSSYINLSYVAGTGDTYNANATFTKSSTGDILLSGNGATVTFKGNVTLNNISSTHFTGSNLAVFSGTANQTLNGSTAAAISFGKLTINKASNNLTLAYPLNITTTLTLTSGRIVTTSTNVLNFADGATVSSASNNSYVQGPVKKTGNDAFTFPTGKAGQYRPIGIAAPTNVATVFTAEYNDTTQTFGTSADTSIANLSDCEYWALTRSGSSDNVNVTLSWDSTSCNAATPVNMRVAGWNGSTWINYGNGARTGNSNFGSVTVATTPAVYNGFTLGNKNCTTTATITPSGSTTACSGSLTLSANTAKYYKWSTNETTQTITPTVTDTVSLVVRDSLGCVGTASQAFLLYPTPTVSVGADTVIIVGDTLQLNATVSGGVTPYTYEWTPATNISNDTIANPLVYPDTLTQYVLRVTDGNGCIGDDTLIILVDEDPCGYLLEGCFDVIDPSTPSTYNNFNNLYGWLPSAAIDFNIINADYNSPDLYNVAFSSPVNIPNADAGYQDAPPGCNSYVGLVTYDETHSTANNMHAEGLYTYFSTNNPGVLIVGDLYRLRFKTSLAECSKYAMQNFYGVFTTAGGSIIQKVALHTTSGSMTDKTVWSQQDRYFVSTVDQVPPITGGVSMAFNIMGDWQAVGATPIALPGTFNCPSGLLSPGMTGGTYDDLAYYYIGGGVTLEHIYLSSSTDNVCAGTPVNLYTCTDDPNIIWSTGQSGGSITVSPLVTTTYYANIYDHTETLVSTLEITIHVNDNCCYKEASNYKIGNGQTASQVWSSADYSAIRSGTSNNITLNTGYPSSSTIIYIDGTFTIDVDNFTFQDCDVRLGANAKIIFESSTASRTLNINDSWLHACGNKLWDGIFVNSIQSSTPDKTLNIDNSLIEDAINAVVSNNCGDYNITGSRFNKNYKHIVANICGAIAHPSTVFGTSFECDNNLLAAVPALPNNPTKTIYAIGVLDQQIMRIGDGLQLTNTFKESDIGIYSTASSLILENNQFDDYLGAVHNTTPSTWINSLGTLLIPTKGTAIYYIGSAYRTIGLTVNGGVPSTSKSNIFNNCTRGVFSVGNARVNVSGNNFNNSYNAIYVWNNLNGGIRILRNELTFAYSNFLSINRFGIFINNYGKSAVTVTDNDITFNNQILLSGIARFHGTGISAWQPSVLNGSNNNVKIGNNTIREAQIGIRVVNNNGRSNEAIRDVHVYSNHIDILENPGISNTMRYGIFNQSSKYSHIRDNWVSGATVIDETEGIRNQSSVNSMVYCNYLNLDGTTNNTTNGLGRAITYNFTSLGSRFFNNQMQNALVGIGTYSSANTGNQVSSQRVNNNKWIENTGATNFIAGRVLSDNTDNSQHTIYVDGTATAQDYDPDYIGGNIQNLGVVFNLSYPTSEFWEYDCDELIWTWPSPGGDEGRPLAKLIINDSIDYPVFSTSAAYLNKATVFNWIKNQPDSMLTDTVISNFYNLHATGNIGKLWAIDSLYSKLIVNVGPAALTDSIFIPADSAQYFTNSYNIDTIAVNLIETNLTYITPVNRVEQATVTIYKAMVDALLRTINPDSVYAPDNVYTLNFTESEWDSIQNYAYLCAYEYGPCVYTARNLMASVGDSLLEFWTGYINPCEVGDTSWARKAGIVEEVKLSEDILIYPNPTNNSVFIQLPEGMERSQLRLFAANGKLLQIISSTGRLTQIDLNSFANGLYFISIFDGDGNYISSKKVSLQR